MKRENIGLVVCFLVLLVGFTFFNRSQIDESGTDDSGVADFHLETDIWFASDSDRTEYVSVTLIQNGTLRAENVRVRGEYIREDYVFIDPNESLTHSHRTGNRETDFGGIMVEWSYVNGLNQTITDSREWHYGRYGSKLLTDV